MNLSRSDEVLADYCKRLIETCGHITLHSSRLSSELKLSLTHVFIALQGDKAPSIERYHAQLLLDDEVAQLQQKTQSEMKEARAEVLADRPFSLSMVQNTLSRKRNDQYSPEVKVDLAETFRRERILVVLGDPGCGKSTLGKWLAFMFARAFQAGETHVCVPLSQVKPDAVVEEGKENTSNLGPVRVPVYLRISEYADVMKLDPKCTLVKYIARLTLGDDGRLTYTDSRRPSKLGDILSNVVESGKMLLVLDGLDEIVQRNMRERVVKSVCEFIEEHVDDPGMPALEGGNQIVITSRVVGYHAFPVQPKGKQSIAHVTVGKMTNVAIDLFCSSWMSAVHPQLEKSAVKRIRTKFPWWEKRLSMKARIAQMTRQLKEELHDPSRIGLL